MSLYTLALPGNTEKSRTKMCIFKAVSACNDYVHPLICNAHANLFGLQFEFASYCNGNNDVWSRIVTYVTANNTLNIPLFLSREGKILISEIRAFALTTCNTFPNINIDKFQEIISCNVGLNPFQGDCRLGGWLDEPATRVLCNDENNTIRIIEGLPRLHKILFQFTIPSIVKNTADNREIYSIPNVWLVANSASDTYNFTLFNKEIFLKRTERDFNVATPVVLMAISERSYSNNDKTFTPIVNIMEDLCF